MNIMMNITTNLYHRTTDINAILKCGYIKSHSLLDTDGVAVSLTRDINYLADDRPDYIVFDYNKLRYNHKVRPYSYVGYCLTYRHTKQPKHRINFYKHNMRKDSDELVFVDKLLLSYANYYVKNGIIQYIGEHGEIIYE